MENRNMKEVRKKFLQYFESKGHTIVKSSSLVPDNDPTLLFTNAGMVQFKNVFLGEEKRDYVRATSSQRCVRAGGKHNDLENVGHTARHHTFFEMLGNFSFGDYFKAEAIPFAWEFLTKVLGLPEEKLCVTVYHTDDEAYDIWHNVVGVPEENIIRIATNDNFWSMGDTGPCGPCTEIFYDHGEEIWGGRPGTPEEDGDRFIEIWNVVFMQYNRQEDGTDVPLAQTGVDTGCGLERLAAVLQHVNNNYEIDLFKNLIASIEKEIGVEQTEENKDSFRVMADHLRSMVFLILDGVTPSNEGRGYVLRRIMRRAMRHANLLGSKKAFIYKCTKYITELYEDEYSELKSAQAQIESTIKTEEERFIKTLHQGIKLLENETKNMKEGDVLSGEVAFKLYDTYGFPLDLTQDALKARGIKVDEDGFNEEMSKQKDRARKAGIGGAADEKLSHVWFEIAHDIAETEFVGYQRCNSLATLQAIVNENGERVETIKAGENGYLVFDKTPFYAESGGQAGDSGVIKFNKDVICTVTDTQKVVDGKIFQHKIEDLKQDITVGDLLFLDLDVFARKQIMKNHSVAHLFHKVLREVVGEQCFQKGSMVDSKRMRFDFSSNVALTEEQVQQIEEKVNKLIALGGLVETTIMSPEEAINEGALALFGEKYGDEVRVVKMISKDPCTCGDDFVSTELCGGTHVQDISEIGLFKIISESSIAAGIRRVEAVTGYEAAMYLSSRDNVLSSLELHSKFKAEELEDRFMSLNSKVRKLEKELAEAKVKSVLNPETLISSAKDINGKKFISAIADNVDVKVAREVVSDIKNRGNDIVVAFGLSSDKGSNLILGVSKELTAELSANELIKPAGESVSLRGGGNKDMATAGGAKVESFDSAFKEISSQL